MRIRIRYRRLLDVWPFDDGQTAQLAVAASLFLLAAAIYAVASTGGWQ